MFNHLLILVDRNADSSALITHAECLAGMMQAKVTLLSAGPRQTSDDTNSQFVDPVDWELQKTVTESYLRDIVQKFEQRGIEAHIRILNNMDADNIIKVAQEEQADLIATVRQTENINDVLHALMKNTRIPVLSLPLFALSHNVDAETRCYKKILLPLDGSKRAEFTLPVGRYLAETFDADLIVTHIIKTVDMPWYDSITDEDANIYNLMVESTQRKAEAYLAAIKPRLPENTRFHLQVNDSVRAALLHLVEDEQIDLMVLSAHGYGGEPKWPYGSIASNLIAYSPAPVLIVQDLPINEVGTFTQDVKYRQSILR
jgi:nucleotide-binding universal stress UspA family protein